MELRGLQEKKIIIIKNVNNLGQLLNSGQDLTGRHGKDEHFHMSKENKQESKD